jgi:hypothetical protein
MILSRYRYRPVTVPLPSRYRPVTVPLPSRYRFWVSVTDRYRFWTNVTQGCPALRTVPQRYLTLQALLNVTERY